MSQGEQDRLSRRSLLKAGAVAGSAVAVGGLIEARPAVAGPPQATGPGALALVNGKIHTMNATNGVASAVAVEDGRFVAVGTDGEIRARRPHATVIDLNGRTVVPGMIEAHVHFVSLAIRPGYHVVIENAWNIAQIQQMLAARRPDVPAGEFITAMGGWHPNMFAEHRLPTRAELDAAVPDRPVLLFQGFTGPSATNSLGKAFLESQALPVVVADNGAIAGGAQSEAALYNLRIRQTFEDKKRSTLDAMAYAASVGITALLDEVGFPITGPPTPTQALSNFDHYRMYDSWLALHHEHRTFIRLQTNFLHNQNDIALPELTQRLKNQFPLYGDDMMMTGAIGEWGAPGDGSGPVWLQAQRLVAQARWRNNNRALSLAALQNEVAGYEAVNAEFDITGLRWRIDHVPVVTVDLLDRLRAMGGAVQCGAFSYVSGSGTAAGAPFRTILDHGIKAGIHLDGVHIAPLNPWFGIYYATTGRNALGNQINVGQQISRHEAVRLYTRENAWFLNMEDKLGSIEAGKLADLVVLNKSYLTVTDDELRTIRPILTMVDGGVVHDTGELTGKKKTLVEGGIGR